MENEQAGYLSTTTPPLYTVAHRAVLAAGARSNGVVVIVGPFAEEKKAAQRALVEAAREFASAGYDVLRFDFRGTGDSAGEFGDSTVSQWLDDLRSVIAEGHTLVPGAPLHLIGLRFGATLAWLATDKEAQVDSLFLCEPIISGAAYMRQNRQRSQIRSQLTGDKPAAAPTPVPASEKEFPAFDFDGFLINSELHREITAIDLITAPVPVCRRALFLQISGSTRIKKPLEELEGHATMTGLLTEMDNVAVEAFWSSIGLVDTTTVRQRTLQWLEEDTPPETGPRIPFEKTTLTELQSLADVQDGINASPLSFMSGDQKIHGVLYTPVKTPERAVILLHGWSGYRIGPGHLLTEAAHSLAKAGYAAYSFDFRGRGESEWDVSEASLNSMIRDAARAVPQVLEKTGASKVTLLGLCSGGEVAIGAGLSDPRIDSLALWSAPVFSGAFTTARQLRRGSESAKKYWQKLFRAESWAKLFSGSVNFKMVWRALSGGRSNEDAKVTEKAPDTERQMKEFEAFKGQLLFIYASNDPETVPSRDFYREFVERTGTPHQFYEVAGANHNYYSMDWKSEVIEETVGWLKNL